ncbi:NAD(P)/FAD-dependent oxidoreductase [Micromonospora sp. NPDC005087]|uniref:NAD(P)/FAD-dependent oxidoreductase n=1 Tax=Micromonospora sp. NPDC005087 TaxID=3364225 RepID=UPI0036989ABD
MTGRWDVIVVGTRVAGAATAMLLARQGLRVLAVDRAHFPSDTISTHQVHVAGTARLHRWGLLHKILAAGAPATRRARFDTTAAVLEGRFPAHEGVDMLISPRRTVLDSILVQAARDAGAEVREGFIVAGVVSDGDRITGIYGRARNGPDVVEKAPLVVGADGKHSTIADAVGAGRYRERPTASFASYAYFTGVRVPSGGFYLRPDVAAAAFPTNDDRLLLAVFAPLAGFSAYRADVERNLYRLLDRCGNLGWLAREGTRVERIRTTPDLPNTLRVPQGPGWALVGDAGLVMDPITAHGISNALRDAELLADAIANDRLATYGAQRDAAAIPLYDFTTALARYGPPSLRERLLLRTLHGRPRQIERFLGMFAGTVPIQDFLSTGNLLRVIAGGAFGLRPEARTAATLHERPSAALRHHPRTAVHNMYRGL